jgi:hypothetical protein
VIFDLSIGRSVKEEIGKISNLVTKHEKKGGLDKNQRAIKALDQVGRDNIIALQGLCRIIRVFGA